MGRSLMSCPPSRTKPSRAQFAHRPRTPPGRDVRGAVTRCSSPSRIELRSRRSRTTNGGESPRRPLDRHCRSGRAVQLQGSSAGGISSPQVATVPKPSAPICALISNQSAPPARSSNHVPIATTPVTSTVGSSNTLGGSRFPSSTGHRIDHAKEGKLRELGVSAVEVDAAPSRPQSDGSAPRLDWARARWCRRWGRCEDATHAWKRGRRRGCSIPPFRAPHVADFPVHPS
jgi:hypothetical protein